jgi:hypothetical protein
MFHKYYYITKKNVLVLATTEKDLQIALIKMENIFSTLN